MADAIRKGASLDPADFIAGGLLDDVDATWKNVKFEMYDYEGKADKAPCFAADMVTGTESKPEDIVRQRWSCGSAENWEPSPDGMYLTPIGSDTELRKASNMFLLMTSLLEAGFPRATLGEGCASNFEGLKAHMRRKEGPKRGNLPQQQTRRVVGGKEYERDNKILLVEKILELPKQGAQDEVPKKGKKAAAKEEAAPKQETSGDVESKAKDVLTNIILGGNGKANKKDIPAAGFKILGSDPDRNKILALLFKDEWITANGFVVAQDGTITLG
jgi:hypothetical protein